MSQLKDALLEAFKSNTQHKNLDKATASLIDSLPDNLKRLALSSIESGYMTTTDFNNALQADKILDKEKEELSEFFTFDLNIELIDIDNEQFNHYNLSKPKTFSQKTPTNNPVRQTKKSQNNNNKFVLQNHSTTYKDGHQIYASHKPQFTIEQTNTYNHVSKNYEYFKTCLKYPQRDQNFTVIKNNINEILKYIDLEPERLKLKSLLYLQNNNLLPKKRCTELQKYMLYNYEITPQEKIIFFLDLISKDILSEEICQDEKCLENLHKLNHPTITNYLVTKQPVEMYFISAHTQGAPVDRKVILKEHYYEIYKKASEDFSPEVAKEYINPSYVYDIYTNSIKNNDESVFKSIIRTDVYEIIKQNYLHNHPDLNEKLLKTVKLDLSKLYITIKCFDSNIAEDILSKNFIELYLQANVDVCKDIRANIYRLFCNSVDIKKLDSLRKIIANTNSNFSSYLRDEIIKHTYDKYTEIFSQYFTARLLNLKIKKPEEQKIKQFNNNPTNNTGNDTNILNDHEYIDVGMSRLGPAFEQRN